MRVLGVALVVWLCCAATVARAAEFPYVAYVNSTDVYVRSGPGRDYYPTDKLNKGERVEVYRHDPGGWYAIRPPRHSFSWVSARNLETIDDTVAVVSSKRAVARVGSALAEVRDVIQVRLDEGEKVELLEPPSGNSPWQKIAPPSGEFRWIFSKFVDSELPVDLADDDRAARVHSPDDATPAGDGPADDRQREVRAAGHDERAPDDRAPASRLSPPSQRHRRDLSSEAARLRELERINLDLSLTVSDEIANWSLAELQQRAEDVLGEAGTSIERGRARVVLNQIARFDDIKTRHEAIRRLQANAVPASAVLARRTIRGLTAWAGWPRSSQPRPAARSTRWLTPKTRSCLLSPRRRG